MSSRLLQHLDRPNIDRLRLYGHVLLHSEHYRDSNPKCISIEGNIGVGKSTFMNLIPHRESIAVLPEQVEEWRNYNGKNLLRDYYEQPKKGAFYLQSAVIATFKRSMGAVPRTCSRMITERSLLSSLDVFCAILLENNDITRVQYYDLRQAAEGYREPDFIIYLHADARVAHARMVNRGRPEEQCIKLPYLRQIERHYNEWLLADDPGCPVLVVNVEREFEVHAQIAKSITDGEIAVPYYI